MMEASSPALSVMAPQKVRSAVPCLHPVEVAASKMLSLYYPKARTVFRLAFTHGYIPTCVHT